jgi:DNA-directed RNA polymerase II subunit RPB1|uniref:DNA-directed RNA polymerase n=1 Tax=viral metagenome TaxID=1070528 RepID=A0A6C0IMA5_9ZZZZ
MNLQKNQQNEYKKPAKIIGIQFSMLSPDEIRKNSVVEITSPVTFNNNKPVMGGLFDPRMGVLEPGIICPTDGLTYIDTPGYFGHIELAKPVFFIQHLKEIMKICKIICFKCSRLLINKKNHKHILSKSAEDRWQYVTNIKVGRCGEHTEDGCGCKQPKSIKLEDLSKISAIWEKIGTESGKGKIDVSIRLTPEHIIKMFKRISDEDVHFMGLSPLWSRPEWMICQVLPVPPPAVRPSVKHDAQQRSEDDLTHIYSNIIKTNKDLAEKISNKANSNVIEGLSTVLQYFVAMIVNNKVKGADSLRQRSGRPLNCIMGRLNSKFGRIRGNLMGKRVDFSARSVITGDPNLSIRELGVPIKIAMNITKPVVVNDRNKKFLLKLVQTGADVHPGAKILEKKNGDNISLRYVDRDSIRLENGDTVHRHMMDGDAVLFNRQPSLHRMSMMCHIVKIMRTGDTFRMNVGDTKPYNADFDGDEMNMHMPQNVLAETELKNLAAIPYQIISPASSSPIIGIFQDSLLGSYRFTRPNVKLTPKQAMNLLMMYPNVDVDKLNKKELTSFDVLSQIMPRMTMKRKTGQFDDKEDPETSNNILEIRNGEFVRGQLDKKCFGNNGITHRIFNDFGNRPASDFIDDLQNVITEYMKSSAFSVGISDLIADKFTTDSIIQAITAQKQEVQSIIDKVHMGLFENNTSYTNMEEFESNVNNVLNEARKQAGNIGQKSLSKNNRFLMIVNSGSKGSLINISQMISCVGQQNVEGKRIPYGFESRTLPHYSKYDDSPEARGFVENSYITGLTAPELFFHAMGGRVGLIDTAVKTSQTGYIQRRLIKGLEDLKVEYDMTVRNNKGKIIQFAYGEDGFDSTRVENQGIKLVGQKMEDIYLHYDIPGVNEEKEILSNIYSPAAKRRLRGQKDKAKLKCKEMIDKMIDAQDNIIKKVFLNKNEDSIQIPVGFQSIILNIQNQLGLHANSLVDITPMEAFELIDIYKKKIDTMHYMKENKLFDVLYHYILNPKDLLINKRFHKKGLVMLLETVILKYKQAIVHPGEMVGVVAGQSIGEPTTQLTLNTFHLSGVSAGATVTRGVPRIEEILRLTKNPKTPSLNIFLKKMDETNRQKVVQYANMIAHTKMVDLIKSVEICFDPDDNNTRIVQDELLMKQYYEFENMFNGCNETDDANDAVLKSKWIIRMEFDTETLLEKNITMDDVHYAITNSVSAKDLNCVYSDMNSKNLVFRLRPNNSIFTTKKTAGMKAKKENAVPDPLDQSDHIYMLRDFQEELLNKIVLRGIERITNVLPVKMQNNVVKEDGYYKQQDIWTLQTTGSNLLDILAEDFIDPTRTISNDIKEAYNVLGIEAARQIIHNEIMDVMKTSGVSINYHHLSLLCDRMTSNEGMVAIFRSGILNDNIGPIAKSTFEVHTEVLLTAARHADFDHMRGVSANIMTGQLGNFGTGACGVVLDLEKMKSLESEDYEKTEEEKEIEKVFGDIQDTGSMYSKTNVEIKNNISTLRNDNVTDCVDDEYDMGF